MTGELVLTGEREEGSERPWQRKLHCKQVMATRVKESHGSSFPWAGCVVQGETEQQGGS